ncbi:hypothetical protein LP419_16765 [Massilia sp. H-1]|nr:hypothetical protein LP419_16765 [Massilia sp. H-1]
MSVTVDGAVAYRVGLTAATMRPLTAASRTSVPRVTSAMRRRAPLTEESLARQPETSRTARATAARGGAADQQPKRLSAWAGGAEMTASWKEVSRIMMVYVDDNTIT